MTEELKLCPSLLPCPFCGEKPAVVWRKNNPRAGCKTDGCWGAKLPAIALDVPEQVSAWNLRAQTEPAAGDGRDALDAARWRSARTGASGLLDVCEWHNGNDLAPAGFYAVSGSAADLLADAAIAAMSAKVV